MTHPAPEPTPPEGNTHKLEAVFYADGFVTHPDGTTDQGESS